MSVVDRGDFASIDRGFPDEHSELNTIDTASSPHDCGYERAHFKASISDQPSARLQAFRGLAGAVSGHGDGR